MRQLEQLLPEIALLPDGQHLCLSPEVASAEVDAILKQKPWIVEKLRRTQIDAAGFYVVLPSVLEREFRAASAVLLSLEVTAATRYSRPERVGAQTKVGPHPWTVYRALEPGVLALSAPRVRALTIHVDGVGSCCFDWDRLSASDKARLLEASIQNKLLLGHNLGQQLSWLFAETDARPAFIADTMLLVQHVRPSVLLRPYALAASSEPVKSARSVTLLSRHNGRPSNTLDYVAASVGSPCSDQEFNHPSSWCMSFLSNSHRTYSESKVLSIVAIFSALFTCGIRGASVAEIEQMAPSYRPYAIATVRLAEAHVRGLPFDAAATQLMCDQRPKPREADALERVDVARPSDPCRTEPDRAQSQVTILKGLNRFAQTDGRLHSLVTFGTVTGRTISQEPPLQNLPRDPAWRALIKAAPGYSILSVDYSTVELRIAAALASRAVTDIQERMSARPRDDWFLGLVRAARNAGTDFPWPTCPRIPDIEWYRQLTVAAAQRVFRDGRQSMKRALQAGIDLHLVTALDMARRQNGLAAGGPALECLLSRTDAQRQALKEELKAERQAAKACNFGLLYGMSAEGLQRYAAENYALNWSLEEATSARDTWFELYPEIALWHLWNRYCQSRKILPSRMKLWDSSSKSLYTAEHPVRLFEVSTLTGRPAVALKNERQALSYQAQGTGADIMALAISELPPAIAEMLLLPIHDELLFEVPTVDLNTARKTVEDTMIVAAERVLGSGIPVELESCVGESWQ